MVVAESEGYIRWGIGGSELELQYWTAGMMAGLFERQDERQVGDLWTGYYMA